MAGRIILLIIGGYFAILGLIQVISLIVHLCWAGQRPQGNVFLRVPENPELTEGSLSYYCTKLQKDESLRNHFSVLLPQDEEAREICRRYCGDRGIIMADLLPGMESIIMEASDGKAGSQQSAAENGTTERDD